MSYGGYNSGGGYGQSNPYDQSNYGGGGYGNNNNNNNNNGYSNAGGYGGGGGGYGGGGYGDSYGSNDAGGMGMQNDTQDTYGGNRFNAPPAGLPSRPVAATGGYGSDILEQCTAVDDTITQLESRLQNYRTLQTRILSDRANITELDASSSEIMSTYRNLATRMKKIKSNADSGTPRNAPQVGRVDRRLKGAMTEFQKIESDFRGQMRDQQARQYRIVNPGASEQEVAEAVDEPNAQIFQQALLNSDRRGQAQTTLNAVRARHEAIQNIERDIIELAEMFQDLDTMVMQQDVTVKAIEEKGVEVQENMVKANEELDSGIQSARGARKKKWICLCLFVLLLVVIAVVVVVYLLTQKKISFGQPKQSPTPTATPVAVAPVATPVAPALVPTTTRRP